MKRLDDLIDLWPSQADLARDIGIDPRRLSVMVLRQSIHVKHWTPIISAAKMRAAEARNNGDKKLAEKFEGVTAESMLALYNAIEKARAA